jgi:hypothetical protein
MILFSTTKYRLVPRRSLARYSLCPGEHRNGDCLYQADEGIPAKGRSNENTRNGVEAEKGTGAVERSGAGLWLRGG